MAGTNFSIISDITVKHKNNKTSKSHFEETPQLGERKQKT